MRPPRSRGLRWSASAAAAARGHAPGPRRSALKIGDFLFGTSGEDTSGTHTPEPVPDPATCSGGDEGAEGAGVGVAGVPDTAAAVEIVLANGRRLCVPLGIEEAVLARLIRLVEGA